MSFYSPARSVLINHGLNTIRAGGGVLFSLLTSVPFINQVPITLMG